MAELRTLSEHCEFGASLDEMLRDRLVCGVNEDRIQRRLLAEPVLDLKKALEIAHGMETAAKDARDLKGEMPNKRDYPMNKLHGGQHSDEYKDCYRCGGKHNHLKCRFKTETCHKCGKMGHIAKVCRSSRTIPRGKERKTFRKNKARGPEMNKVEQTGSSEESEYNLFSLKNKTLPYSENLNVNG
jgi:hypothetical protein